MQFMHLQLLGSSVPHLKFLKNACGPTTTSWGPITTCWGPTTIVFARNRDTAVPAKGNSDLQTLICVLVARPRRCPTLSNPVPWQNWMAAYLSYTLRMKTLFRGWPVMVGSWHAYEKNKKCSRYDHRTEVWTNQRWEVLRRASNKHRSKETNTAVAQQGVPSFSTFIFHDKKLCKSIIY